MNNTPNPYLATILDIVHNLRLAWQLFRDKRVPLWTKGVPLAALAYLVWPLDILADPALGLGQLDDLAIIMLGIKAFVSLCPPQLVAQLKQQITTGQTHVERGGPVVDTTYRVVTDDDRSPNDPATR